MEKRNKKRMQQLNNRYSIINSGKFCYYIINKNQLTEEKENQIKELIDGNKLQLGFLFGGKNEFTWQEITQW